MALRGDSLTVQDPWLDQQIVDMMFEAFSKGNRAYDHMVLSFVSYILGK
ncbi:MAG: hypothetical protein LRZ88_10940 [Candidatus Cloacimonetes bacterium]|nr:hypothetical protein [Candidatus Cloacimonadota bacterium]